MKLSEWLEEGLIACGLTARYNGAAFAEWTDEIRTRTAQAKELEEALHSIAHYFAKVSKIYTANLDNGEVVNETASAAADATKPR